MSATEILVVAVCLFVGYWVVSKMMTPKEKPQPQGSSKNDSKPNDPPPNNDTYNNTKQESKPLQWYEVLKVSPNATVEQIQEAYKKQIRQYHPDKVNNLGEELRNLAEEKSKAINVAYQTALRARGQY